jgi:hypothetical protein
MRLLPQKLPVLAAGLVLVCQTFAIQVRSVSQQSPIANSGAKPSPAKPNCISKGTYVNINGQTVPRPENCSEPPKGATAQCRDGTYSFSKSRRGTCSHHGGVAKWLSVAS